MKCDELKRKYSDITGPYYGYNEVNEAIAELKAEIKKLKRSEKQAKELADPYTQYCEARADVLEKAIGDMHWHKVSEEIPKTRSLVLVIDEDGCYDLAAIVESNDGVKYWDAFDDEGHEWNFEEIKYWMPLPEPPED